MSRQRKIGGTDASAIVGVNPYRSAIDTWARLVENRETETNQAMRRGTLLEPVIRQMYLEETHAHLAPHPGIVESPRYAFATASPDDLRADVDVGIEYKSASLRTLPQWGEPGTDQVPQHYLVQCAWYMAVLDKPEWELAVFLGGEDLRIYRIARDFELESMLLERCGKFWTDYVVTKQQPPPDDSKSYGEYLAEKYPESNGVLLPPTPELEAAVARLRSLKEQLSLIEAEEREARNSLLAHLGPADGVEGLCTYRQSKGRATVNWMAVMEEAGVPKALVEKYTTRNPYRVLRLKGGVES